MPIYVEVAINLSKISGSFHYHLPPELEEKVHPGVLVIVPFGHQRVQGIVTRFITVPDISETKPVEELVDEKAVLTPTQIALAHWMAEEDQFKSQYQQHERKIWAGAHRLSAFYLLNEGKPGESLKAYWRSFWNHPPTALKDWRRMGFALLSPLRPQKLRDRYLERKKNRMNEVKK